MNYNIGMPTFLAYPVILPPLREASREPVSLPSLRSLLLRYRFCRPVLDYGMPIWKPPTPYPTLFPPLLPFRMPQINPPETSHTSSTSLESKGSLASRHRITRLRPVPRTFPCLHCDKQFQQAVDLRRHDRTHTNERPYACTKCDRCFRQKGHLNEHMRRHDGDRRFACKVLGCKSRFF